MPVPAHCLGKEQFDRATANRVARETHKVRLDTFRCSTCGYWHVGVPRSGRNAIKRKRLREFGGDQ